MKLKDLSNCIFTDFILGVSTNVTEYDNTKAYDYTGDQIYMLVEDESYVPDGISWASDFDQLDVVEVLAETIEDVLTGQDVPVLKVYVDKAS